MGYEVVVVIDSSLSLNQKIWLDANRHRVLIFSALPVLNPAEKHQALLMGSIAN